MSSFGAKLWWNNEQYKEELTAKADAGAWFVVADEVPGRVIRVVYAGYKIKLPDDSEVIVSPDTLGDKLKEVTVEQYPEFVASWQTREDARLQQIRNVETARLAKLEQQRACQHPRAETYTVVEAAGCDIHDTYCLSCDKILRRSWSTAYDRDPDDHVSDWDWWVREHTRLYKQAPNRVGYNVVDEIADDYPHYVRRPRPEVS